MTDKKKTLYEQVLEKIQHDEAVMRPRWYFVAQAALFMLGVALLTLVLIFLVSFLTFTMHLSGAWFVPIFGPRTIGPFLWSLPWILILLAIGFIVLLEYLVQRYSFAYRRPLLYSALGVLGIAVIGGFILSTTPLHRTLFLRARDNQLPIAGSLYRSYAFERDDSIHVGRVTEFMTDGFRLQDRRDDVFTVVITKETHFPLGKQLATGDVVVVFGPRVNMTLQAFGVRPIDPEFGEFHPGSRGLPLRIRSLVN